MKEYLLLLVLTLFTILGCKKTSDSSVVIKQEMIQAIQSYIKTELLKANQITADALQDTYDKMLLGQSGRVHFNSDLDAYIIPVVDIDVSNYLKLDRTIQKVKPGINDLDGENKINTVTKAIFYLGKDDRIVGANIIEISSKTENVESLDARFVTIAAAKTNDFNGRISVNSLKQRLLNAFEIRQGKTVSSTTMRPSRQVEEQTNGRRTNATCMAWYLYTTYFYPDGSTSEDTLFLGTTGCSSPPSRSDLPDQESGPDDITPPDTLCAQSHRLSNDPAFLTMVASLASAVNYTESGYARPVAGGTFLSVAGNASGVDATSITYPLNSFFHNHTTNLGNVFTLQDLQAMYVGLYSRGMIPNLSNFSLGLVTSAGTVLMLRVPDVLTYNIFASNNLATGATFDNFYNRVGGTLTSSNSYEVNLRNLMNILVGTGIDLYEGSVSNLSAGFSKVNIDASSIVTRQKCQN